MSVNNKTNTNNNMNQNKKRKASHAPEQERGPKKQKQIQPDPAAKQTSTNEIDDIFSKKNTKNNENAPAQQKTAGSKQKGQSPKATTQKKPNTNSSKGDDIFWKDSRGTMKANRKYTEDGLPVYSEDELNIGKGGDTPLCPFDCTCCY